ncbi:MAG TPA: hypothetical protein VIH79_05090 [Candidatus Nanopelagicaceae bacterium]
MSHPEFPHLHVPHWRRPHVGEHRWPVSFVVAVVIILQYSLPKSLSLGIQPEIVIVEAILTIIIFAISPGRIESHRKSTWWAGVALTGVMTTSNIASAVELVRRLVDGTIKSPTNLLAFGGSIWLTNIVVFSLWYWEFDRGGPGARAEAIDPYPDFLFPQMTDPEYAPATWTPTYFDYLFTSYTNASAFSPTDVMPLTRWAKMLMMLQSAISLITVGLVIARAVNILR